MRTGHVVAAVASPAGDVLTAAVAVSDTVLHLSDLGNDFNESGGLLLLAGAVLAYVSADDEAATVTLAAGAPAAVDAGEPVIAWDDLTGAPVYDTTADVELDDGQVVTAEVPHELSALIVESLRTGGGEAVEVAPDGDAWTVLNVIGILLHPCTFVRIRHSFCRQRSGRFRKALKKAAQ